MTKNEAKMFNTMVDRLAKAAEKIDSAAIRFDEASKRICLAMAVIESKPSAKVQEVETKTDKTEEASIEEMLTECTRLSKPNGKARKFTESLKQHHKASGALTPKQLAFLKNTHFQLTTVGEW